MKLDADDPRLTAYVLEELEEPERSTIDAALRESATLHREARALHDAAQSLLEELQALPRPGLAPEQAEAVERACAIAHNAAAPSAWETRPVTRDNFAPEPVGAVPWFSRWFRLTPWLGAATAVLVAALTIWKAGWLPTNPGRTDVAMKHEDGPTPTSPPPAVVVPVEPQASDTETVAPTPDPTTPPPAITPAEPAPLQPKMDLRMMMRYGLLPMGVQGIESPGTLPPPSYTVPQPPPASADPYAPRSPRERMSGVNPWRDAYRSWAIEPPPIRDGANPFLDVRQVPLSTFGLDVDTAAYTIIRRYLHQRQAPPRDVVRLEELINYFPYDYAPPTGDAPLAAQVEIAGCPWEPRHRLVRIGLKTRELAAAERPPANLVFLIDVSGSMSPANKLPLLQQGLRLLVERLNARDRVAIVVYATESRVVLRPTPGDQQATILDALASLRAGGSTHGSAGIQTAYELARSHFQSEGVNRVILCTDGDFNVGLTDRGELADLIAEKARTGVFLTALGFGMGNYQDATLETLAHRGNGHYAYVDNFNEAHKVLVEQLRSTLVTVAKDVKAQVEFNPAIVRAYRLLGYDHRQLRPRDFNDDRKDAGELGAGHAVTVLYELVPVHPAAVVGEVDPLKYQPSARFPRLPTATGETLTLKLRYQPPDGHTSQRLEFAVTDAGRTYAQASTDFKFAAAVAAFGLILQEAPARGSASFGAVLELAAEGRGHDELGYRAEFLDLVRLAQQLRQ
jgi:Ca-activated chloride channel family protein